MPPETQPPGRPAVFLEEAVRTPEGRREAVLSWKWSQAAREAAVRVLDEVGRGRGGAWWIHAGAGMGKSHFLAVVAALLSEGAADLLPEVPVEEVRRATAALGAPRWLVVACSLRDRVATPGATLTQIVLDALDARLREAGWSEGVPPCPDQAALAWLRRQGTGTRADLALYVAQHTGAGVPEDPALHPAGPARVASLVREYCATHAIAIAGLAGCRERLSWVCAQLRQAGWDGLLVALDDLDVREVGPEDEEFLETLAHVLPGLCVGGQPIRAITLVGAEGLPTGRLAGRFAQVPLHGAGAGECDVAASESRVPSPREVDALRAWVQALAPDLELGADPAVAWERVRARMAALREEASWVRERLERIAAAFRTPIPADDEAALALVEAACRTCVSAGTEGELLRLAEEGPAAVRRAMDSYDRQRQLAERAEAVERMRRYVDAVALPECERELASQQLSLRWQLSFDSLLRNPRTVDRLAEVSERFVASYQALYHKHHREIHRGRAALRQQVRSAAGRLAALRLLDTIPRIAAPEGGDLEAQWQRLEAALSPCARADDETVSVVDEPVCPDCRVTLLERAPKAQVVAFRQALDEALEARYALLRRTLADRILQQAGGDHHRAFLDVLQLGHLDDLERLLTEEVMAYLRALLSEPA